MVERYGSRIATRVVTINHLFTKKSPLLATLAVLLPMVPLVLVVAEAMSLDVQSWGRLLGVDLGWQAKVWRLLFNTFWLTLLTAMFALLFAVPTAWLMARYQFWGRRWLSRLLVLPVAIPPYLFAVIYSDVQYREIAGWQLRDGFNVLNALIDSMTPVAVHSSGVSGFAGAAWLLALAGFPYLYLLLKQRMQRETVAWHDSARLLGVPVWRRWLNISLPWWRPALLGGLTIIALHVLADYGTVYLLSVQTFTSEVFKQVDMAQRDTAAAVSVVLLTVGIMVVAGGWFGQKSGRQTGARLTQRAYPRRQLRGLPLALAYVGLLLLLLPSVLIPLSWLVYWSWQIPPELATSAYDLLTRAVASFGFAAAAAALAMLAGLVLCYYRWRYGGMYSQGLLAVGTVGFVLPGPIVALGLLLFTALYFPALLNSYLVLIVALAVRYLPVAIQGEQAALQGFSLRMLEASQLYGYSRWRSIWRVMVPAIKPGLLAAAILTGIEMLKDLPMILMLKPHGIETLPMALWEEATQESEELAARSALLLVVLCLPLVAILDRENT